MFLILHANIDPYMGGDFTFCDNKDEVLEEISFIGKGNVFNIFELDDDIHDFRDDFIS